jgi:hypothetical protein
MHNVSITTARSPGFAPGLFTEGEGPRSVQEGVERGPHRKHHEKGGTR